ncbi:MAG: amidase, partial [Myxococcales bacterium]|nr:amidase [Myxococcales bacterium]
MNAPDRDVSEAPGEVAEAADDTGLTRRSLLAGTSVLSGAIAAELVLGGLRSGAATAATPGSASELVGMSALELSKAIRSKRVSCREVMVAFLDQIERVNPVVNAIVSLQDREALLQQARQRDAELARGEVRGWMHGLPHAVKDLAATRGIRTTWGSPLLDTVPQADDLFVERLRKSGAIFIGKTNTPEFGLGSQTYNTVFGTTRNAYDPSKTAGGSSGGAAAALALRMLPVADGSDMMGSLRNPAAFNNVIGFRPSHGRVPYAGGELFLDPLSVEGPMGRSVADVAMLLAVMAGPDSRFPPSIEQDPSRFVEPLQRSFAGTRLAWLGNLDGTLPMEPGILELCEAAFPAFRDIGCSV